ncbi:MAG: sigma-70 family RNA polymerase sigma factor, partial [Flavisolibacter sp.]|nr:sigma-70 family RNA polymerase sigma factor [Flavisolibacter sp.]
HLCEDILQEAYVRFWNNMEKVKDDDTAIFLLKRYTRNLFLDEMRKLSRRESLLANLDMDATAASAEELAIEKERYTTIQAAIEKLPAQQKRIFRMHKEQALSYRQISEQLGVTTGTIETQMNRALKFLRKELAGLSMNDPAFSFALIYYALTTN